MSWRVSQTPECSGLLTATRGFCVIDPHDNASEAANRTILLMIEASLTCEAHE
jgi:hypothetical protein